MDLHRSAVRGSRANGEAAQRSRRTGVEARHGDGDELQVVAVHPRRIGPGDHCPFHDSGGPGSVATGRHHRPFRQQSAVGNGQSQRHLGCDVDVHHPSHASLAKEVPGASGLPDDGFGHDRSGVDDLEGVDLYVSVQQRTLAHVALVRHHHAFLEPSTRLHIRVLSQHATSQAGVPAQIRAVMDHASLDHGARVNHHAAPEHAVIENLRPRLDPAVLADERRPDQVRVRAHLRAVSEPDAVTDLKALYLHLHLTVENLPVRLKVRLEIPHVRPVSIRDVAEQGKTLLEQ